MWQGHQNTCPVTCVCFEPATASMVHSRIYMISIQHYLVTRDSFNIGNKAHTTRIFLHGGVVEPTLFWEPEFVRLFGKVAHVYFEITSIKILLTRFYKNWFVKHDFHTYPEVSGDRSAYARKKLSN